MLRYNRLPLPDEMIFALLSALTPFELANAAGSFIQFYSVALDQLLWKTKFKLHFPHLFYSVANEEDVELEINWHNEFYCAFRNEYAQLPIGLAKLFTVIKENDIAGLIRILDQGIITYQQLETCDAHHFTVIDWAKEYKLQVVLNLLYEKIIIPFYSDQSTLFLAAAKVDETKRTILHQAIRCRQSDEQIKLLIISGVNKEALCAEGMGALHLAAEDNQTDNVNCLITQGVSVNTLSSCGATALLISVEHGHTNTFYALLKHSADMTLALQAPSPYHAKFDVYPNDTPLHAAALHRRLEFSEAMISKGLSPNITYNSKTALHAAAQEGHKESIELLIKRGAHINTRSAHGATALLFSIENEHDDAFYTLLANHANTDLALESNSGYHNDFGVIAGDTPLHVAVRQGRLHIVEALIQAGSSLEKVNSEGDTPLLLAIREGHLAIVKTLKAAGAKTTAATSDGDSALFLAIFKNRTGIAKYLLSNGCDYNERNHLGVSALFYSVVCKRTKITRILLSLNADTSVRIQNVDSILSELEIFPEDTALHAAVVVDNPEAVIDLLKHRAEASATTQDGFTALHLAVYLRRSAVMRSIFQNVKVNINDCGKIGITPLLMAVLNSYYAETVLLLENGADATLAYQASEIFYDICDTHVKRKIVIGDQPLHVAIKLNELKFVEILLANAIMKNKLALIAEKNNDDQTPLDLVKDKKSKIAYQLKLVDYYYRITQFNSKLPSSPHTTSSIPTLFGHSFKIGLPLRAKKAAARDLVDVIFKKTTKNRLAQHEHTLKSDELRFIYQGLGFK